MGRKRNREMTRAIPIAMPQELTMPKAWKKRTKRMGRGILSREKMVFFDRTKSALLLATKIAFITPESVQERAKKTKA